MFLLRDTHSPALRYGEAYHADRLWLLQVPRINMAYPRGLAHFNTLLDI